MKSPSLNEKDYQLEKLEFALAISESEGDKKKSDYLRSQIESIGLSFEEPGT